MRILLLWDFYESYLRQFYLHNPGVSNQSFADQNRLLLSDGFSWNAYLLPSLESWDMRPRQLSATQIRRR